MQRGQPATAEETIRALQEQLATVTADAARAATREQQRQKKLDRASQRSSELEQELVSVRAAATAGTAPAPRCGSSQKAATKSHKSSYLMHLASLRAVADADRALTDRLTIEALSDFDD